MSLSSRLLDRALKSRLFGKIAHEGLVHFVGEEVSRFFDCPKIKFDVELKEPEAPERKEVSYTTFEGIRWILKTPESRAGASFEPKGEKNIISFYGHNDSDVTIGSARHEIIHSYHYRSNESIRRTHFHLKELASAYNLLLASKSGLQKDDEVPDEIKETLAKLVNTLVKRTVCCETVVEAYTKLKKGDIKQGEFSHEFTDPKIAENTSLLGSVLNFWVKPSDINIRMADLGPFFKQAYLKAYYALTWGALANLSVDYDHEPKASVTLEDHEKIPPELLPYGKVFVVRLQYELLPDDKVVDRLKEWFHKDCNLLVEEFSKRIHDQQDRYYRALSEWYSSRQKEDE